MFWLIPVSALLLIAAEPTWRTKPVAQWTEEDAKQVLQDSPWAKTVTAGIARRQSEDELREGGQMGQPHGLGYDGVDPKGSGPKLPTSIPGLLTGARSPRSLPGVITLKVVWESALPIRAAELKARFVEPPTLASDGYSIAVYGIPGDYFKGDPKKLGDPLKNLAALKREGKKDVRPSGVEVFEREGGSVVVYEFPPSTEISKKDGHIEFKAQIGRIGVDESFDVGEMEFQGKLEL
ncbi:MAG: hypothetical protein LAP38_27645 [Acidobacteriia bacterium]|nr:hypothetical protein [Terriglobia bacterium]